MGFRGRAVALFSPHSFPVVSPGEGHGRAGGGRTGRKPSGRFRAGHGMALFPRSASSPSSSARLQRRRGYAHPSATLYPMCATPDECGIARRLPYRHDAEAENDTTGRSRFSG